MGNFFEYMALIITSLLWPPEGIILMEEQLLQRLYATIKAYLTYGGAMANILIAFAVYAVIMYVIFERRNVVGHMLHRGIRRIVAFIGRLLFVIFFSWGMLVFGAVGGMLRGEGPEDDPRARQNITIRRHYFHFIDVSQTFTRISWHFRFGRWLFRTVHWLLGHIGVIAARPRLHRFLARAIAIFIIIYRAWEIPYLLTH